MLTLEMLARSGPNLGCGGKWTRGVKCEGVRGPKIDSGPAIDISYKKKFPEGVEWGLILWAIGIEVDRFRSQGGRREHYRFFAKKLKTVFPNHTNEF